jgi:hypothetical protein
MKKLKLELSHTIERLEEITKNLVTTRFIGNYKSVFKGKGLEFADYRKYSEDDDASLIDWKATVRANQTLVKEYVEERNLNIFFLIDASSSMILGSTPKLKIEYAAELIASLSYAILNSGDCIGLVLFSDHVTKYIPLDKGPKQFYIILDTLVNGDFYGGNFNFSAALEYVLFTLPKSSLLIIVSDFIIPGNNWEANFKIIAEKFDTIGIMVRDPRDITLPKVTGQVILSDPFTGKKMFVDTKSVGDLYKNETKSEIKKIKSIFLNSNSDLLLLTTNKDFFNPLIDFFKRRKEKWR